MRFWADERKEALLLFLFFKMQGIVFTLADAVSIQGPSIILLSSTLPRPPLPPFSQVGESEAEIRLSQFFFFNKHFFFFKVLQLRFHPLGIFKLICSVK